MPQKRIIKRYCKECDKEFFTWKNEVIKNRGLFCSYKCMGKNKKKTRIKIKCPICGKDFSVKKYRINTAKYCSRKCLATGRGGLKGKYSPTWKGGITPLHHKIRQSIEYRLWREAVFARDNWTCQKCKKRGSNLEAHHIKRFKEYPELRFAIDNGQTLCIKCHNKTKKGKNNVSH